MAGRVIVYTLLAVFAAMLIVPFVIGLVQGPGQAEAPPADATLRPLARVAGLYGRVLTLYGFVAGVYFVFGQRGADCANTAYRSSGPAGGYGGLHGATIRAVGAVQACAPHPSGAQWILYLMMRLPGPVLLATVLLVIWQLVREASRNGPFTARTAAIMWRLGLVVLIGTAVAGAISQLGNDLLLQLLMVSPPYNGSGVPADMLFNGSIRALLPVPALAGAALLSFARITRAGAALDEEVRATV